MTDNAINAFQKALPCATSSRMLIDMANSLDVADDHLRVKARRDGFFSRMLDAFSETIRMQPIISRHSKKITGKKEQRILLSLDVNKGFVW